MIGPPSEKAGNTTISKAEHVEVLTGAQGWPPLTDKTTVQAPGTAGEPCLLRVATLLLPYFLNHLHSLRRSTMCKHLICEGRRRNRVT